MRKVAIIGLSHSKKFMPWDDPTWERWQLRQDPDWIRADRLYEIHDEDWIAENGGEPSFNRIREVIENEIPIYMREPSIEGALRYPLEDAIAEIGRDYFESSIAFMFVHALMEGVKHIGLWGVSMAANTEYAYQKPNMEWLLGIAQGRGVRVDLPEGCPLLQFNGGKPKPRRDGRKQLRYGQWQLPNTAS